MLISYWREAHLSVKPHKDISPVAIEHCNSCSKVRLALLISPPVSPQVDARRYKPIFRLSINLRLLAKLPVGGRCWRRSLWLRARRTLEVWDGRTRQMRGRWPWRGYEVVLCEGRAAQRVEHGGLRRETSAELARCRRAKEKTER